MRHQKWIPAFAGKTISFLSCTKTEFTALLYSKNDEMQQYRFAWRTITLNICIACTAIGLIAIAGQLIYSKLTCNRALFFFQQPQTTCEEKIEEIQVKMRAVTI